MRRLLAERLVQAGQRRREVWSGATHLTHHHPHRQQIREIRGGAVVGGKRGREGGAATPPSSSSGALGGSRESGSSLLPGNVSEELNQKFSASLAGGDTVAATGYYWKIHDSSSPLRTHRRMQMIQLLCRLEKLTEASELLTMTLQGPSQGQATEKTGSEGRRAARKRGTGRTRGRRGAAAAAEATIGTPYRSLHAHDASTVAAFIYLLEAVVRAGDVPLALLHFRQARDLCVSLDLPLLTDLTLLLLQTTSDNETRERLRAQEGQPQTAEFGASDRWEPMWEVLKYTRQLGMKPPQPVMEQILVVASSAYDMSLALDTIHFMSGLEQRPSAALCTQLAYRTKKALAALDRSEQEYVNDIVKAAGGWGGDATRLRIVQTQLDELYHNLLLENYAEDSTDTAPPRRPRVATIEDEAGEVWDDGEEEGREGKGDVECLGLDGATLAAVEGVWRRAMEARRVLAGVRDCAVRQFQAHTDEVNMRKMKWLQDGLLELVDEEEEREARGGGSLLEHLGVLDLDDSGDEAEGAEYEESDDDTDDDSGDSSSESDDYGSDDCSDERVTASGAFRRRSRRRSTHKGPIGLGGIGAAARGERGASYTAYAREQRHAEQKEALRETARMVSKIRRLKERAALLVTETEEVDEESSGGGGGTTPDENEESEWEVEERREREAQQAEDDFVSDLHSHFRTNSIDLSFTATPAAPAAAAAAVAGAQHSEADSAAAAAAAALIVGRPLRRGAGQGSEDIPDE